jgi:dihydrofolate reductase
MRKIVVGAQVSLDGVMQAPGGPTEDPTGGFRFGGWSMPHWGPDSGAEIRRLFEGDIDLLLGRKTYEIFAAYWPYYDESGPAGWVAKRFNEIRKYVVSRSGEVDTGWEGTVLLRNLGEVGRLTAETGPDLITQGSTELVHSLLAGDLVDAMSIFTAPVVLGGGKRLFVDGSAPHSFILERSLVSQTGVIVGHYVREGEVKTESASLGEPSERELARQERMRREG